MAWVIIIMSDIVEIHNSYQANKKNEGHTHNYEITAKITEQLYFEGQTDLISLEIITRKPNFSNAKTKVQICFLYIDSTMPLLSKSEISSLSRYVRP